MSLQADELVAVEATTAKSHPASQPQTTRVQQPLIQAQTPGSNDKEQPEQRYVFDLTSEQDKALNHFDQDAIPDNMSPTEQM